MNEKKVVSKRVFIELEIVCIILIACLVGATLLYSSQVNDKNSQISSLQSQVYELNKTINLSNWDYWVNQETISQPQDSWTNWTFNADYAGYVSVQVYNSTILNPSARVVYAYQDINYDQQEEGPTEAFPVMPSNIKISVGNGPHVTLYNATTGLPIVLTVNETVTITYYY
jgi:hypothetical protein